MKKVILFLIIFPFSFSLLAQKKSDILEVLARQQANWNKGDIPAFMEDYWKSEDLKFIGKSGVVKGWKATLDRYEKSYSNRDKMGTLEFDIQEVDFLSKTSAWVLGKWYLKRPVEGDVGGYFTLIFKKINGNWVVVSDHTS